MADEPVTEPQASDAPAASAVAEPAPKVAAANKTFTQADVDKIVQDRVAKLNKRLEIFDQLESKAAQFDKLEEAQKSELQKAQDRAAEAETKAKVIMDAAELNLKQAAVLTEATRQNAMKPEHMFRLIDTDLVTVDDGKVIGADKAVASFLSENGEYVGASKQNTVAQGARGSTVEQLGADQVKNMTPQQIVKAQQDGQLSGLLSGQTPH